MYYVVLALFGAFGVFFFVSFSSNCHDWQHSLALRTGSDYLVEH